MPAPPPPSDARSRRLAEALRANLRRRKASPASIADDPGSLTHVGDGAEDGEALYPRGPGGSADGRRS